MNARPSSRLVGAAVPASVGTPTSREPQRLVLVAEQLQGFRGRSDEGDAGIGAGARKARIFRVESVAGMDRRGTRLLYGAQDCRPIEIASDALPRQRGRRVDLAGTPAGAVVGGMDRDAAHAEIGSRAENTGGDFAAVGDEQCLSGDAL